MRARRFPLMVLFVAGPAAPAQAQWVATPYIHGNYGDVETRRGGPGISVGYLGRRTGFELDFDRHHHFFKDEDLETIPNPCVPGVVGPCIDDDTDARIFMGNLLVPLPVTEGTSWRPYGTAGLGAVHAWIHGAGQYDTEQTNLAVNVGGGAVYWLNDWFGFRGDLRYFYAFVDDPEREGAYFRDYDWGRLLLGVTFGFPR